MSTTPTERLLAELGPNRRNLATLLAVVAVLAVGYLLDHWAASYGSYLVAFSIWMIWFVLVLVEVLQYDW
jgi:hypothetical protein